MNLDELRTNLADCIMTLDSQTPASNFAARTYFAGGCVRDWLLTKRRKPITNSAFQDVDICVEMEQGGIILAELLQPVLKGRLSKCHPEFGTASLSALGLSLEFIATRRESYSRNNRYPKVFPGTLQDDVLRRDITINSLLMNICSGEVIDLCGKGIHDLEVGIIRSLGNPAIKFSEDPLRMLRALRFSMRFGFPIEPLTLQCMVSMLNELNRLSPRLIKQELTKMSEHSSPDTIRQRLRELGWDTIPKLSATDSVFAQ